MKKAVILTTLLLLFTLMAVTVSAAPPSQTGGQEYIVQNGDWLSKLAEKYYGDMQSYPLIIEATNAKAAEDNRFIVITNPNTIEVGQTLWIPDTSGIDAPDDVTTSEERPATIVEVPKTNCEIRIWYNYQVIAIPVINQRWIEEGLSLEGRAERAFEIRHNARVDARFMMADKEEVEALRKRDMEKYGNPDGPTFSYLVAKNQENGLEGDAIYEAIIESSSRTSPVYNDECIQ